MCLKSLYSIPFLDTDKTAALLLSDEAYRLILLLVSQNWPCYSKSEGVYRFLLDMLSRLLPLPETCADNSLLINFTYSDISNLPDISGFLGADPEPDISGGEAPPFLKSKLASFIKPCNRTSEVASCTCMFFFFLIPVIIELDEYNVLFLALAQYQLPEHTPEELSLRDKETLLHVRAVNSLY